MSRTIVVVAVIALVLASAAFAAVAPVVIPVEVQLSPAALVLDGPGVWVTAHTDIRYSAVIGASVELKGISATSVFADDRGYLVAKFRQAAVEAIVAPPCDTLTLTGLTVDGVPFEGSDTIRVMVCKKK